MKFLIDAHLPMALKNWLINRGHDVIHTRDLPKKNETDDMDIIRIADSQNRIITSKDSDFQKHHILFGRPERILMITTGNIVNKVLCFSCSRIILTRLKKHLKKTVWLLN